MADAAIEVGLGRRSVSECAIAPSRPAVESGRLAAGVVIAASGRYTPETLASYARAIVRRHPAITPARRWQRGLPAAAGRALLSSPLFTRRVVLDRWFLGEPVRC
jgi:hypothetical protein